MSVFAPNSDRRGARHRVSGGAVIPRHPAPIGRRRSAMGQQGASASGGGAIRRTAHRVGFLCAGLLAACLCATAAQAGPPRRVVSINVCTDQLALLLAAPGQLLSVSRLASDPRTSALADLAAAMPANSGQAEEVFLLHPDLVLAGTFSARPTVDLLRRLGIPVVELPPARSFDDIRAGIAQIGAALGRDAQAAELTARFDAGLSAIPPAATPAPRAALYYANGYTTGRGTLAQSILEAAGLRNLAAEAGIFGGAVLPLESLVLADPDIVVTGTPYPGASRSEEVLTHPALRALMEHRLSASVADPDWLCGTPAVLDAVARMAALRAEWAAR